MSGNNRGNQISDWVSGINYTYLYDLTTNDAVTVDITETTKLGKSSSIGVIDNTGDKSDNNSAILNVEISEDGTNFGDSFHIKAGKTFTLDRINIHSIRLTREAGVQTEGQIIFW